ncbi:MAG TPA: ABC transporter permease [Terriglobales bacterium]|jgi:ABC-2 type transport system permease protein
MSTQSNAMPESFQARGVLPASIPAGQPFLWSVRRELWEYRFICVAPLSVAAAALLAFSISVVAGISQHPLRLDPSRPQMPYDLAAGLMMLTGILVSVFYCVDALHGERRDRSILFWKSMPVSDATAVLAKASIPLVIVPILIFVITIAMHCIMLLVSCAVVLASGQSVATLWNSLPLSRMWLLLFYHIVTGHALWPFPIYCWLLLVSGWASRATFLWAALPIVTIAGIEGIIFRTAGFAGLIGRRLFGDAPAMSMAPDSMGLDPMTTHVTIGRLLSSPGLWIGFATAAIFLAAAVRSRRYRAPI